MFKLRDWNILFKYDTVNVIIGECFAVDSSSIFNSEILTDLRYIMIMISKLT